MPIANLIENGKRIIGEEKGEIRENIQETIQEKKELIEDLFEKVEEYAKTNVELIKLKATDKVADIVGSLVAKIAIVILAFFFILMINIAIAFWIGNAMGKTHYGFFVVAGFYALITIVLFIFQDKFIKSPINNSIIEQVLKVKSHEQNKS